MKREQWASYLSWAVDAFRLTAAVAAPETQIVTHLCYSEFEDILESIDRLDGASPSAPRTRHDGSARVDAVRRMPGDTTECGESVAICPNPSLTLWQCTDLLLTWYSYKYSQYYC